MRIYWDNLIEQSTLTPSEAEVNQDVNLLKQPHLASTFKFGAQDVNLVIDLGSIENIKHFIVNIGNLTGNGTYTLEANSTDVWTSPTYSETLIITDSILYLDLDETYQFWRLKIIDTVNIELGYISMGGSYTQMPGIDTKVSLKYSTTSKSSFSVSGQVYGDEGYEYLETSFSFPQIFEEEGPGIKGQIVAGRKQILEMWKDVSKIKPVWVMLWEKNLDEYAPLFCVLNQNNMAFKKLEYGKYYSTKISLKEVF